MRTRRVRHSRIASIAEKKRSFFEMIERRRIIFASVVLYLSKRAD
jgi:hypothetical protein